MLKNLSEAVLDWKSRVEFMKMREFIIYEQSNCVDRLELNRTRFDAIYFRFLEIQSNLMDIEAFKKGWGRAIVENPVEALQEENRQLELPILHQSVLLADTYDLIDMCHERIEAAWQLTLTNLVAYMIAQGAAQDLNVPQKAISEAME